MHKKLALACMAISVLSALALAPAASASPIVTEGGTAIAAGSSLRGTNTGLVRITGAIPTECTDFYLAGTLTKNGPERIEGEIPAANIALAGTGEGEQCTSPLGSVGVTIKSKLCWQTSTGTDTGSITGCGAGVTYTLSFAELGSCKYSAASLSATFKTSSDFTFNIFEQPASKEEGGTFCPGQVKLDADLDFNTTDGTTLLIS